MMPPLESGPLSVGSVTISLSMTIAICSSTCSVVNASKSFWRRRAMSKPTAGKPFCSKDGKTLGKSLPENSQSSFSSTTSATRRSAMGISAMAPSSRMGKKRRRERGWPGFSVISLLLYSVIFATGFATAHSRALSVSTARS